MPKSSFDDVIAEYRKNFHKIYYSEVLPILEKSEKKRIESLIRLVLIEIVLFTIVFFLFRYGLFIEPEMGSICIVPGILVVVLSVYLPFNFNGKFVSELKNVCIRRILKAFGDLKWSPQTDIVTDNQLNKSDLFSVYNTRSSDDAFWGTYKDVKFSVCETNLVYVSGSGKNKTVHNIFNGVVINFESNKKIKNKTIIATKGDQNIKGNRCVIWTAIIAISVQALADINAWWLYLGIAAFVAVIYILVNKLVQSDKEVLNEIKLEDPEFNKKYKAYSSDEIEGRYLITPAFMERFNNVKTAFGAQKIKCSFYDEYLMFAITSNKNLFEIGNLFHSLKNPNQMKEFFEELVSILVLVDYFKLDEKTGL